jgi:hypothetical protein
VLRRLLGDIYFCLMEGLDAVEPCPGLEIHVPVICVVFVGCGVFKRAVGRGLTLHDAYGSLPDDLSGEAYLVCGLDHAVYVFIGPGGFL